jgi:hypothetical protein
MLFIGIFSTKTNAQETIKALIKKCETLESVDVTIVRQRDQKTKKISSSLTTLRIKSDPTLVKEFQDAFQKAYDNGFSKSQDVADHEMITRRAGKIVRLMYTFGNIRYDFSVEDNGHARLNVMERNEEDSKGVGFFENFGDLHFNLQHLEGLNNLQYSIPFFQLPDLNIGNFEHFKIIPN